MNLNYIAVFSPFGVFILGAMGAIFDLEPNTRMGIISVYICLSMVLIILLVRIDR